MRLDAVAEIEYSLHGHVAEPLACEGWIPTKALFCRSSSCGQCARCENGFLPSEKAKQREILSESMAAIEESCIETEANVADQEHLLLKGTAPDILTEMEKEMAQVQGELEAICAENTALEGSLAALQQARPVLTAKMAYEEELTTLKLKGQLIGGEERNKLEQLQKALGTETLEIEIMLVKEALAHFEQEHKPFCELSLALEAEESLRDELGSIEGHLDVVLPEVETLMKELQTVPEERSLGDQLRNVIREAIYILQGHDATDHPRVKEIMQEQ